MRNTIDTKQNRLLASKFSILLLCLCFVFISDVAQAYEILMGTGKRGSFSHFTGRTLCRLVTMETGLKCRAIPAPDPTHNLTNLRSGALDIALIDSRMLNDAFTSRGYFQYLDISYENLRTLVSLYTVPVVLVAREDAGIRVLDDLKGKRINAGAPLSMHHLATDAILLAKGWTKRSFRLMEELPETQSQDRLAFSRGAVQAMFHIGVHPDPTLQGFIDRTKARLVNMDDAEIADMLQDHNCYTKATLPPRTYSENTETVTTFGTQVILTTSEDLDDATVQTILEIIWDNREKLKKSHPALSEIKEAKTRILNGEIRPHQAAIQYFLKKE